MIQTMTTNLMVKNTETSKAFYMKVLDFKVIDEVPNVFVILGNETINLMIEEQKAMTEEFPELETSIIKPSVSLYIKVQDVVGFVAKLEAKGFVVPALHETFYGTLETYITDPDGYIVSFSGVKS